MKRILVVGMYGAGNIGDDMILASVLKMLRDIGLDGSCSIVSYNVNKHRLEYPDRQVYGVSKKEKIKSVYSNDIVLVAGGTSCQDKLGAGLFTGILYWYIEYVLLCVLFRRKTYFFGIGCDEITSKWGALFSKIMSFAQRIYTRDERSTCNLSRFVPMRKISEVPDLAYYYLEKRVTPYNRLHLDLLKADSRKKILVNVLGEFLVDHAYLDFLAKLMREERGTLFVIANSEVRVGLDHRVVMELLSRFPEGVPENVMYLGTLYYSPAELMAIVDSFDAAIVMRMHLGIMSVNCGKPVFILSRSDKTKSFAEINGFGFWDINERISYDEFYSRCSDSLNLAGESFNQVDSEQWLDPLKGFLSV